MMRVPPRLGLSIRKLPALSLDPVGEAAETGPAAGRSAADAVVRNLDHELSLVDARA